MSKRAPHEKGCSGSVFTTLLAGTALVGAISYMVFQTMSGPVATMSRTTNKAMAEQQMLSDLKLIIASTTSLAASTADCDADKIVEFPEMTTTAGGKPAIIDTSGALSYGALLPTTLGLRLVDPWGTKYGYCVWDAGAKNDPATDNGCGANARRLAGPSATQMPTAASALQTAIALVSAGPDRKFQTTCKTYAYATTAPATGDGSNNLVTSSAGADDIVVRYTYDQASQFFSPQWVSTLATESSGTRSIAKNLEVGDVANPNATTGLISALSLNAAGVVNAGGGLQLADRPAIATCPAGAPSAAAGTVRYNAATPGLEFCANAGGSWTAATGGATGATDLNGIDMLKDGIANTTTIYVVGLGQGALCKFNSTAAEYGSCTAGTGTGARNTATGQDSAKVLTSGTDNTAYGYQALTALTTGSGNTGFGYQSLKAITTASNNTAAGASSLAVNTASDNTAAGYGALIANTSGTGNTAAGYNALAAVTTTNASTAAGYNALTVNTAAGSTAAGTSALAANTSAIGNAALGDSALIVSTGANNTAMGSTALVANTSGTGNTAAGVYAAHNNTTGTDNTAIGFHALGDQATTTTFDNTAIGYYALDVTSANRNTAIGKSALLSATTASGNTAIGAAAMTATATTGVNSVAVGYHTLFSSAATDTSNTAIGYEALRDSQGDNNTAIGYQALASITTPSPQNAFGYQAMNLVDAASCGMGIGYQALQDVDAGNSDQVAIGYQAARDKPVTGRIVDIGYQAAQEGVTNEVTIGSQAMANNSVGSFSVAIGYQAYYAVGGGVRLAIGSQAAATVNNGMGQPCTAFGSDAYALSANCYAYSDFFGAEAGKSADLNGTSRAARGFGYQALMGPNTGGDDAGDLALGWKTLKANTTGINNTAIGAEALTANTTASQGVAIGYQALKANTTGGNNTAAGYQALLANTTGGNNTSAGYGALVANTIASDNTAIGYHAMNAATAVAISAAASDGGGTPKVRLTVTSTTGWAANDYVVVSGCTTSNINGIQQISSVPDATSIILTLGWTGGWSCASGVIGGLRNTAVGSSALGATTQGGGNTAVGYLANPAGSRLSNLTCIGYNACNGLDNTYTNSNRVYLGDGSISNPNGVKSYAASWSNYSDRRLKKDIEESDLGLDFVMKLRPVSYRRIGGDGRLDYGFIAQEVEEALGGRATNIVSQDGNALKTYHLSLMELATPATRAVQEQKLESDKRQADIDQMKTEMLEIQNIIHDLNVLDRAGAR